MKVAPLVWSIDGEDLEDRFDADYYRPEYLEIDHIISQIKNAKLFAVKTLKEVSISIRKGIFYILASEYREKGIPFLRVCNLKDPLLDESDLVYISEDRNKENIKTSLGPGDLAISKSGQLGLVSIIPPWIEECNVSQDVIAVKVRREYVPEYILCYLLTNYGQKQLKRGCTRVAQPHLELKYARKLQIIFSEKKFQLEIKELINEAQSLRKKINTLQFELEKLSQTLRFKMPSVKGAATLLVKEEDLTHRLDPLFYYYKDEVRKWLEKSPYKVKGLDEIAKFSHKKFNPRRKPAQVFRYVEIADVNRNTGEIENFSEIIGAEAPSRARMLLKANSIVLSSLKGSLRSVAIVPPELDNAIGTTGFFVLEANEEIINKESLWWILRSDICQRQLEQIASGAIMPAINEWELKQLKVPIPPLEIQKEIKTKVEEIQRLRKEANRLVERAIEQVEKIIETQIQALKT